MPNVSESAASISPRKDDVTLAQQIACVEREILLREKVYPKFVATGRMAEVKARMEIESMTAVRATLIQFREFAERMMLKDKNHL